MTEPLGAGWEREKKRNKRNKKNSRKRASRNGSSRWESRILTQQQQEERQNLSLPDAAKASIVAKRISAATQTLLRPCLIREMNFFERGLKTFRLQFFFVIFSWNSDCWNSRGFLFLCLASVIDDLAQDPLIILYNFFIFSREALLNKNKKMIIW